MPPIRLYIYIIKPNLKYIKLLENKIKNHKFYCIKVKFGTHHTKEFYDLNNIKITSPYLYRRKDIKCQACYIKDYGVFYRGKTFDIKFDLKISVVCLMCGLYFKTIEDFEKHKKIHLKYY